MDAEACKELWRVMYKRFADADIDNLIWVFTPAAAWQQPFSDGMRWYPGDEYVDIVGFDIYHVTNARTCYQDYYKFLQQQCPDKLIALTEFGDVARIGSQWAEGAKWLFFMPWYDYDRTNNTSSSAFSSTNHGNADISWWQDAWKEDFVLSRDQVKY